MVAAVRAIVLVVMWFGGFGVQYNITYRDYQWANLLAHTVSNYQLKAWHRWKIQEAAAATAANQRLAPFIIGGDFYGPDYKIQQNASYIGVGRIYRPLEKPER